MANRVDCRVVGELGVDQHDVRLDQDGALDTVLAGLDILQSAKSRLRGSGHGRVLVEMALVRLCRLDDLVSLTQLAQMLQGLDQVMDDHVLGHFRHRI